MLRRRTRQNGALLLQVFFLLAPLLLPGLRPEKLREKLSRRLPGKTGAAKFYGERVHKLYGLVIRCSNTLSPKHGRVPLTFFRGHQSAENFLRAIISSGRITADGDSSFRRYVRRPASGMAETGAQVDVQPPPLFPAHRPSVKMAKNDDFRFRKKTVCKFPHAPHHRQPCQKNPHGPFRRPGRMS